ncbi:MAG: hypothetical protein HND47_12490 [Chloroflexi bacterium]|nr:hypothetical protein [Chloroflexota bacterium]
MKRILYTLLTAVAVLMGNYFFSNGTLEVNVETPTPIPSPTLVPLPGTIVPTPIGGPAIVPTPAEARDPYGELYFTIITPKAYYPPETPPPYIEATYRLARLPGSCVVGLEECPEPDIVQTPFNLKDVYSTSSSGMIWSPDGRYGLLVSHPEDELSVGRTKEELEKLKNRSPSEFEVSPSTIHLFDAQTDSWSEVYRAERKFFSTPHWSSDGQWITFSITNSPWAFHPLDADDGIYIVRPDGSGVKQVSAAHANILGWIGNSILLQRPNGIYPSIDYRTSRMEMLALDGETKPLFETDRVAFYSLAPDGGTLLVADSQGESGNSSIKAVDVLALDGSITHSFGMYTNLDSSIYPSVWSPDGSLVAFANLRRVYVAPRDGSGLPNGTAGIPPDVREVYVADDTFVQPSFWNLQISNDNKYLLMDVYDGMPHFVTVSLETGQTIPLEIKGMTESEQASWFSWRQ